MLNLESNSKLAILTMLMFFIVSWDSQPSQTRVNGQCITPEQQQCTSNQIGTNLNLVPFAYNLVSFENYHLGDFS